MRKLLYIFFAVSLSLSGCGGTAGDFDFAISPDTVQAIKSNTASCLSKRSTTDGSTPPNDVTANYAQIKGVSFSYPSTTKSLVIDTIEFKFDGFTQTVAGDALLALNLQWMEKGEAVVGGPLRPWYSDSAKTYTPAKSIKIDCPLYLSGLPSGVAYQKSGSATVYGRFEDAANNEDPAQAMGFVTVIWRGD